MIKNDITLSIYDDNRKQTVETILEIASRNNGGGISKQKLENIGISSYEGLSEIMQDKSIVSTEENAKRPCNEKELEEAIQLYIDLDGQDGTRLVQGYIYYLCTPLIKSMWADYATHMSSYKKGDELSNLETEFNTQAYFSLMNLLASHAANVQCGKTTNRISGFMYLFKNRIKNEVFSDITKTEFSDYGIYKSLSKRQHAKLEEDYIKENGHEASDEELAAYSKVSSKIISKRRQELYEQHVVFLDETVGEEDSEKLIERVSASGACHKGSDPYNTVYENSLLEVMREKLDTTQRFALLMLLGYNEDNEAYSVRRIARELSVTPYTAKKVICNSLKIILPYVL